MTRNIEAAEIADFILRKIGFVLAAAVGTFLMFPGIALASDAFEPDALPGTGAIFSTDGTWIDRSLDAEGDEDWFELSTTANQWYSIEAKPSPANEWVDGYLEVYTPSGTMVAYDDDNGMNLMPRLLFKATETSTYDVKLRGYSIFTTGEYSARAEAIVPGTISGHVTSPTGDPLGDVEVNLFYFHDGIWRDAATAQSAADGSYSFVELAEGSYRIGYYLADSLFPPLYYPGVQSPDAAESITLEWGDDLADINQQMQTSTRVGGTVLNWNGSLPLTDVRVTIYLSTPDGFEKVENLTTDENGAWAGRLVEGTYRVEYTDNDGVAVRIFHPDAGSLALAQDIVVGAEGANLTAKMPQYANLTGTVTDAHTGDPIANAWVDAYRMTSTGLEYFDGALTFADGSYEIGMYTGTYVLTAHTQDLGHLAFINSDSPAIEDGTRIAVGPSGEVLDFELTPAADITGSAYDLLSGDTIPGATVQAQILRNGEWAAVGNLITTEEEGAFTVYGLVAGTYRLVATHPDAPEANWFAPGVRNANDAETFEVAAGERIRTSVSVSSDTEAPITSLIGLDQVAPVTVQLLAVDSGSGVAETTYRVDGAEWLTGTEIHIAKAGRHTVEFYSKDAVGNVEEIQTADVYAYTSSVDVSTLAGANRYQTAVEVSKDSFPDGADAVVVASGRTWADGLAASALAGALDAPILLVPQNAIPGEVAGEVARLAPNNAWIVGGDGVVGSEIERFLTGATSSRGEVTRLGGENRYATAAMVAETLIDTLAENGEEWDGTYILAAGSNFPDALAASPVAASMSWPILLTGTNDLNAQTAAFLQDNNAKDGILLGGCGAVCTDVADEVKELTGSDITRVAGTDRYLTALAIAEFAQEHANLGTGDIAIASGQSFPDALTSGIRQARNGSILILTPTGSLHSGVAEFLEDLDSETVRRVTFVGGVAAVSQDARVSVLGALGH